MAEDEKYIYSEMQPGVFEGCQCAYCGLCFCIVVMKPDGSAGIAKTDGSIDLYCPKCGKNLKSELLKWEISNKHSN